MLNLHNLKNKCFIQISSEYNIKTIEKALLEYKASNILCLFFHYDNNNIEKDYELIKVVESKTKIYINYIDISALYNEAIKINKIFKFYPNIENNIEIRNKNILTKIINDIKENLIKYYSILEFKDS